MKQLIGVLVASSLAIACSSKNSTPPSDGSSGSSGTVAGCEGAPQLEKADYCSECTVSKDATPATCKAPRVIDACCTFVAAPTSELARGTGLHRYSSDDANVNLGCLDNPGTLGTPQTVTLTGFVRLFSSGNDSAGVKIEIYKEGTDGALGELVGTPVTTTTSDAIEQPKADWLKKCPDGGCSFRAYTYTGVPTETPLIVKTSD